MNKQVEQIKAEIEKLEKENCMNNGEHFCMRRAICLGRLRQIISPMQEEPVSEDFNAFEKEYLKKNEAEIVSVFDRHAGLVDGAKWQREQMIQGAVKWIEKNFNMPNDFEQHFREAMNDIH